MNRDLLSSISGKSILKVSFLVHEIGRDRNLNPQAIKLQIFGASSLFVKCASDGETLVVETNAKWFECREMGEFGREVIENVTEDEPWKKYTGMLITAVRVFKSLEKDIGFSLLFRTGEIFVFNVGDEIVNYEYFPTDIFRDENVSVESV
ncbi:hypothetical protein [Rhizobium sp.]|uniref:hypothetical protein n=1 Tax=Rhizobium sp. TaxID=391 RepID=UPI00289DF689